MKYQLWLTFRNGFFLWIVACATILVGLSIFAQEAKGTMFLQAGTAKLPATEVSVKGKEALKSEIDHYVVRGWVVSPNRKTLVAYTDESKNKRRLLFWDLARRKLSGELPAFGYFPQGAFSPNSQWVATFDDSSGTMTIRNVQTGEIKNQLSLSRDTSLRSLSIDWKNWIIASAKDGKPVITLWDLRTGKPIKSFTHPARKNPFSLLDPHKERETQDAVWGLYFISNGEYLLSVSTFSKLYMWNVRSGELERILVSDQPNLNSQGLSHGDTIYDVAIDPTESLAATASRDGTASLWDLSERKWLTTISGFPGKVYTVDFSPDGRILAACGGYKRHEVKLWDVENERLLAVLSGFKDWIYVSRENFSLSGKMVITDSPNGKKDKKTGRVKGLAIWNTSSGRLELEIPEAYSPAKFAQGNTFVTTGPEGEIILWDLEQRAQSN